jgi:hypothetical protein
MACHQPTFLGYPDHDSWMLPVILSLESSRYVGHFMAGCAAMDFLRGRNKLCIGRQRIVFRLKQG